MCIILSKVKSKTNTVTLFFIKEFFAVGSKLITLLILIIAKDFFTKYNAF